MKNLLGILFILIVAVGIFCLLNASINEANQNLVSEIKFDLQQLGDGQSWMSVRAFEEEILANINNDTSGIQSQELDLQTIEATIEQIGFVAQSQVYLDANDVIHIKATQKEPLVRIMNSKDSYYLDVEGSRIPLSNFHFPRVPVAHGKIENYRDDWKDSIPESNLSKIYDLSLLIADDEILHSIVESIWVDPDNRLCMYTNVGSFYIILNDLSEVDEKINRLKLFLKNAMKRTDWRKLEYINLSFTPQIVVKRKINA